ncbi:MAG: UDP-N-acetylglucosamine diphosphorylase/glucosamine-1-phosphate N-acetyltransferase [Acidobacteria bacterium]|nr:MAG: UDP-N-acetylglucosamine diphosphorylase/glucosamine-1-phosphate N-acetyltransferase [Acidobacteriota bacterium]
MTAVHVVVLAAGKSTRMKSARPKVLHDLSGRMLIEHVLHSAAALEPETMTLVVGHAADDVRAALAGWPSLQFVVQAPQLGTGHALLQAESVLKDKKGVVLLLYGDVPLLSTSTLQRLLETHRGKKAAATILTTEMPDPYGYGRIVRDAKGNISRIVEERDASAQEHKIREINSGIYAFNLSGLFDALHNLANDNAQGEYYLTDLVAAFYQAKKKVESLLLDSPDELRGINSRVELAEMTAIVRARKNRALMIGGVTLEDPSSAYIDEDVTVGADTTIGPNVRLQGKTSVGERCRIEAGSRLAHVTVGNGVTILDHCVITEAVIGDEAKIGPFAHVRPASVVGPSAHVGNFVELKKTTLGKGSKANHLAYLGDAKIGDGVNVGAGTITCNYDGVNKHVTTIEDGAFIGSDTQLIAPVTIGRGAYVGTGTTVREDVPAGALAVSAGKQRNIEGWVADKQRRRRDKKE